MATRRAGGQAAPSVDADAYELAVAKLASSGLAASDMALLGMTPLSAAQTVAACRGFKELPSLRIDYFDPRGMSAPLSGWPGWPPFYRVRYLRTGTDFADLAAKKPPRYAQPPDSGVCAYFPRNADWPSIIKDPRQRLLITEGELKAAKACAEGFPTVGLGGVNNYRSSRLGVAFLPELEAVDWVGREAYLVFDSDVRTNMQVAEALNDLAEALMARGAMPYFVALPDVAEAGKTGLDDYLLARTPADLSALVVDGAQPLTLARALWRMNGEVVYVQRPGLVMVQETGQRMTPAAFKDHAFSARSHAEQLVKPDGSVSMRPCSAAQAWLSWPLRREAGSLTYEPGRPTYIEGDTARTSRWNVWSGWGVEPAPGDATPFLDLVAHLFAGAEPGAMEWFLRWCAFPLQHPGTKLYTSVLVYGLTHGTGKSLVGVTLGRIYGANYTAIDQKDLHNDFNEWAENKQFAMGDDVTGSNKREDNDRLKRLVTQETVRINAKHLATYVLPDCLNYYFSSNHPDAFFLEDEDRRNFIHEVLKTTRPLPEDFYMDYGVWLDTGGPAALFHHLLNLDLGDFNPNAPAFRTVAKDRMIADVRSDLGSWVRDLLADPDRFLRVGDAAIPGDLFTNRLLLQLYDPSGRTGTTANGLGRELRRAGAAQVCDGRPIKTADGQDRYYVVRNADLWATATAAQASRHLATQSAALAGGRLR